MEVVELMKNRCILKAGVVFKRRVTNVVGQCEMTEPQTKKRDTVLAAALLLELEGLNRYIRVREHIGLVVSDDHTSG